jgi:Tn3 transposase DDE domain
VNLVVAAIILWNTVYLDRAVYAKREHGQPIDESLFQHVAPIHWNHINLTGDYNWRQNRLVQNREIQADAAPTQCGGNFTLFSLRIANQAMYSVPFYADRAIFAM